MNLKLLKLLSKNARLMDDELAVMTGADEKDVHKNIAEMEAQGQNLENFYIDIINNKVVDAIAVEAK